jgi:hypothetical protein
LEASKIAGHSKVSTTLDYTIVGLKRQDELTRRTQEKRAKAGASADRPRGAQDQGGRDQKGCRGIGYQYGHPTPRRR